VLLTAVRLGVLQHTAWDAKHARDSLNISAILDREIECVVEVIAQRPRAQDDRESRDIFNAFLRRMQKLKESYESRIANETRPEHHVDLDLGDQLMDESLNLTTPFWDSIEDDLTWLFNGNI
jgi:hypothetical protein